ncbi:MAG: N-acetylmuramoyl-L-alanine amidase, partial [Spirochaetaceae bacterium]|nr:N-acetylmuramoyl-L-alanine amidase [Spirochaetaceae bacterium]
MAAWSVFAAEGRPFNLLSEVEKAGAAFFWDPLSASGVIEKNGHSFTFREGSSAAVFDNRLLVFVDPPEKKNGSLYVSQDFLSHAGRVFSAEPGKSGQGKDSFYKIGAILIDPGHGGKDPGTNRDIVVDGKKVTVLEKDITLEVSKLLYAKLKKAYPGKKIQLTRSDDRFLSLDDRVEIAHSMALGPREAVLYISVHVNASP